MVAAIWSNIFDYALLYQMKKINYNLTNQLSHQQFPPKHHHRYHHYQYKNKLHRQQSQHRNHRRRQRHHHHEQQQQQPSQQYHNDVEMKHFQSYITKFSENLSKKYNKSSDRSMPKRISDEPLSEITNSVNLTNEKSSEFELVNEEHFVPNNDTTTTTTATDTTNKNTLDLNIDNNKNNSTTTNVYNEAIIESLNVPISKDCPSNINMIKKECKLSCSFSSSSSSSASSSASPSSLTSSSSSLLLLSSQNVDNVEKMDDRAQLSNNNNNNDNNTYTDNSFTTDKLHNSMHKFRKHKIKGLHSRDYHFGDNYHSKLN